MKAQLYGLDGKLKGEVDVGEAFSAKVRADIIGKVFAAEQSWTRHPYGPDPLAGKRTSAHYHGERSTRYSMMNKEMARMKRIHNQGYLNMTARFVPQAVKGRAGHPPKVEKVWEKKVNKKERLAAILSAVAATADKNFVSLRGHLINGHAVPFVMEDSLETLKRTKDVFNLLAALGLEKEMERVSERKVRAGKGKNRGRRYKNKSGPLIVVKEDKGILKAAGNIAGVSVTKVSDITISLLAPGGSAGRLTLWTKGAVEEINRRVKG